MVEDITLTHGITAYFSGDNDGTLVEVNTLVRRVLVFARGCWQRFA